MVTDGSTRKANPSIHLRRQISEPVPLSTVMNASDSNDEDSSSFDNSTLLSNKDKDEESNNNQNSNNCSYFVRVEVNALSR